MKTLFLHPPSFDGFDTSWQMTKRRLREGVEFFHFLRAREA